MNKTKICLAISAVGIGMSAVIAAPSMLKADPIQKVTLADSIKVDETKKDSYVEGYDVELVLDSESPEYKSVTVGEGVSAKTYNFTDKKANIKVPVLSEAGEILEGAQTIKMTYTTADDKTVEGTLEYTVEKGTETPNINLDLVIADALNIKASELEAYKTNGATLTIDLSEIAEKGGITFKKITTNDGKDADVVNNKATFNISVVKEDGTADVGTHKIPLKYYLDDENFKEGSATYEVTYTDDAKTDPTTPDKPDIKLYLDVTVKDPIEVKASQIETAKKNGASASVDISKIVEAGDNFTTLDVENVGNDFTFNENHIAEFTVPLVDSNGKVLEGKNTLNLTYHRADGSTESGTFTYNVTYTDDAKTDPTTPDKPDIKLYLDVTVKDPIEVKASQIEAAKNGAEAFIDISDIVKAGDNFKTVDIENVGTGISFGDDHIARFKAPVVDANGKVMEGTQKLKLTYNRADGSKETGTFTYTVKYTNDVVQEATVTISSNVTAKVNGVALTSGKKVAAGDTITITATSSRGKVVKGISLNGQKIDSSSAISATYTVKADDTALSFDAILEDAESYKVTIPENVTAVAITDSENISLKSGDKVYNGEKVKITATAPTGKVIKSIKVNGTSITNGQSVTVNGTDIAITVEYEDAVQVSITIPDGVSVTKNGVAVKSGDKLTKGDEIKIVASKAGYNVKSLTVNGTTFVNGSTYTVGDKNVVIAVEFVSSGTTTGTYPVTIKITDDDEDALKDVKVLIKDSNKEKVATAETDKKGKIELDLAPGRYNLAVTSVPDGYLEPSDTYTFTVGDNGKVRGTTSITLSQSEVVLQKIDAVTKKGVAGASIVVKNEDKETVATGVTDSNGELKIKGLPAGKYTYSERYSASGYAADNEVYKFTINDDGKVTGTTSTTVNPISIVFTVKDYASGKGIAGATLVIKNQLGRTVATVTTNSNGEASVPGLTPGRYVLSQSEAPSSYARDTSEYTFDVLDSGMTSGVTSITNKQKASSSNNNQSATAPSDENNKNNSATAPKPSDSTTNNAGNSTTNSDTTTTNGNNTSSNTTSTTTTVNGKPHNGTVKTGVETVAPKSKAPIIAGIVGAVGVIAGAASFVFKKKGK